MKYLATFIALFMVCSVMHAQKKVKGNGKLTTESRTVTEFEKVGVAGSFDVLLVQGREGEITVEAEENLMQYIITEVKSGHLKIKTKKGISLRSTKGIKITVGYDDLNAVSLAGSGDISNNGTIKSNELKLSIAGSGDINVNVSTKKLVASIAGSGDIEVQGDTEELKCSIAGSGDFSGFALDAKTASASIAGSGDVEVNAADKIKAQIAGSGNVYYKGNPEKDIKKAGSGGAVKKN